MALKDAGLVEEKEGRWNRVFEVWMEGMDDWSGERKLWVEMAACADDEAELARMMGGAGEGGASASMSAGIAHAIARSATPRWMY